MKSNNVSIFREILSDNKAHITKQRIELFHILNRPEPQSMRSIVAKTKGRIDRVSVYRNIELFETIGIIKRIHIGWKYKLELTDRFLKHHHHLSCMGCGRTIDIEDEAHIEQFIQQVARSFRFSVLSHQFEIEGYCEQCKKP